MFFCHKMPKIEHIIAILNRLIIKLNKTKCYLLYYQD
jgi:hypothetical protein